MNNLRGSLIALAGLIISQVAPCTVRSEPSFRVEGLAIGQKVVDNSSVYKQYKCGPSEQFTFFIYCRRMKHHEKGGKIISAITTILHDHDGVTGYVNEYIYHASINMADAKSEIGRLSQLIGLSPHTLTASSNGAGLDAILSYWGGVTLSPLSSGDYAIAAMGESPHKGILVDFIGDFVRSAKLGLPIFEVNGSAGFVWVAHFNGEKRGGLRFFAIDASRLIANGNTAGSDQVPPLQILSSSEEQLRRMLKRCTASCKNLAVPKHLMNQVAKDIAHEKLIANEARAFKAALGDTTKLQSYIHSCKICEFEKDANANLAGVNQRNSDQLFAETEEREFDAAKGNSLALKQYVADCKLCAFAEEAVADLRTPSDKLAQSVFDFTVCNNDILAVNVAIDGTEDPLSKLQVTKGWYVVPAGQCRTIGSFVRGAVYIFARNRMANWNGNSAAYFCAPWVKYSYVDFATPQGECPASRAPVAFDRINVNSSSYTYTLTRSPTFTALAYSPGSSAWGWSSGASPSEAQNSALTWCARNAPDCVPGPWVRDDICLALAQQTYGGGKALGWATNALSSQAEDTARAFCQQRSGGICIIVKDSCSP